MEICEQTVYFNEVKEGEMPLHRLKVGKTAKVKGLLNNGISRRRLLDLGIIPNSIISVERKSPSGNPIAYNIRGSIIALRVEEAKNVIVEE